METVSAPALSHAPAAQMIAGHAPLAQAAAEVVEEVQEAEVEAQAEVVEEEAEAFQEYLYATGNGNAQDGQIA